MISKTKTFLQGISPGYNQDNSMIARPYDDIDRNSLQNMLSTALPNHQPVALPVSAPNCASSGRQDENYHQGLRRKTPTGIITHGYHEYVHRRPFKRLILQAPNIDGHALRSKLDKLSTGCRYSTSRCLQHQQDYYQTINPQDTYQETLTSYGQIPAATQNMDGSTQANATIWQTGADYALGHVPLKSMTGWYINAQNHPGPFNYQHDGTKVKHIREPIIGFNERHVSQVTSHDPSPLINCDPNAGYHHHDGKSSFDKDQHQPHLKSFTARVLDLPKDERDWYPTVRAGDPGNSRRIGSVKAPHDAQNISNMPEQRSRMHELLRVPTQDTCKSISYPDHVLSKANTLYATMISEAQRIRDESIKSVPLAERIQVPEGFACLEAPRILEPDLAKYRWPTKSDSPRRQGNGYSGSHHLYCRPQQSTSASNHWSVVYDEVPNHAAHVPANGITHLGNGASQRDQSVLGTTKKVHPNNSAHTLCGVDERLSGDLISAARSTYQTLRQLCIETGEAWTDPMHLAGCFAYAIGELAQAAHWFKKVATKDNSPIALSNLALTSLASEYYAEAETYWHRALKIQPSYFEAAEHLVSLLCNQRRHRHAVQAIDTVKRSLMADVGNISCYFQTTRSGSVDLTRLLALLHAKGNILYALHDHAAAAKAFEEVLSLALGVEGGSSLDLVHFILNRLTASHPAPQKSPSPLLLTPEEALRTMQTCFGHVDYLPGLHSVSTQASRRAALSITSDALLTLAKILQDTLFLPGSTPARLPTGFGVSEILALYYLSLSIQPSPSTSNNVGILLVGIQQSADGSRQHAGAALALQYYQYGLNLDPKHAHLYTNLGSLLKDLGQLSEAIKMYEKAVSCDPAFDIALANLANAVKEEGRTEEAIHFYKRAVVVNPAFVEAVCGLANALSSTCAWDNRGGMFMHGGAFDRWHINEHGYPVDAQNTRMSSGWLQRVVTIVDDQLAAGSSWGSGFMKSDDMDSLLRQALIRTSQDHHNDTSGLLEQVYLWCGNVSEGSNTLRLVERANRQTNWQWYKDKYLKRIERPQHSYSRLTLATNLPTPTSPTVLPFHTFTLPLTAKQIRLISQRNGTRVSHSALRASWLPPTVFPPPPPPSPHLNVGYVSSDFNNHPLSHLMQSVFGMHDSTRVKAFCYATTASDNSAHRSKIEEDAPVFYDASSWTTERLVHKIVQDHIHILINLNGYTRGARNEVFAARPAPIQMSFMGFAGSMGAEWSDYLLADEVAVPLSTLRPHRSNVTIADLIIATQDEATPNHTSTTSSNATFNTATDWIYNENVIYTSSSFFCCDHLQAATPTERARTWPQELLHRRRMRDQVFGANIPPDAIILANFNQLYKIDPTTFRTWLRILSRVPNAYLWLLRFPASGEANLLRTARLWAPEDVVRRLIFTDVAPKAEHISRGCVADLFLDTPECNAHTTAADCLWSGTPLLTLPRYEWKMCSRMAAGILRGALPMDTEEGRTAWTELVVGIEEEYEDVAVSLASGLVYRPAVPLKDKRLGQRREKSPKSRGERQDWADGGGGAVAHRGHDQWQEAGGVWEGTGRLMDLRKMIWEYRWTCPLFDTRRWVRDLEVAYKEAWRRWVVGEGGDIWLKHLL